MTPDETPKERHARLKRERQARYRAEGRCVLCAAGLTDDRAGMSMCCECAEKHRQRQARARKTEKVKTWRREWARAKYQTNSEWRALERLRIKIYQATRGDQ